MRLGMMIACASALLTAPLYAGQTTASNYQCSVNAAAGTHDCGSPITVGGSGSQRTATIDLSGGYVRLDALVDVCNPTGYWMHLGDSPTNDGNGGDGFTTYHDAEVHTSGTTLMSFGMSANQLGVPSYTDVTNNVIPASGCRTVQFTLLESEVRFDDDGDPSDTAMYSFLSPYGFEAAPYNEADTEDSSGADANKWYAGINRVVHLAAQPGRVGTGTSKVCFVLSKSTNPSAATISSLCSAPIQYAPFACFDYSPLLPKTGQAVFFDSSCSSDPDGLIVSYAWDFGDGSTSSNQQPNHVYQQSGSYYVTLTITDDQGKTDVIETIIDVDPAECTGIRCFSDF